MVNMRYYLSTKDACYAPNAKNADPISLRWPHNVVREGGKQHDNGNLENDAIARVGIRVPVTLFTTSSCGRLCTGALRWWARILHREVV